MMSDLESSNLEKTTKMMQKSSRTSKKPDRFGEMGNISDDDFDNSFERMLSDDSSDDFVPETDTGLKRNVIFTIGGDKKRMKGAVNDNLLHDINWGDTYDDEFDQRNPKDSDSNLNIEQIEKSIGTEQKSVGEKSVDNVPLDIGCSSNHIDKKVTEFHSNANDNRKLLLEILARIKIIEDSLLKKGVLAIANSNGECGTSTSFDEFHTFQKSNRLPLKNIEDMDLFERNLCDLEFRGIALKILSNFPGIRRTKGNQIKLLKSVIGLIVDRLFLTKFTYSGKYVKGHEKKMSFKEKENIVTLLFSIVSKIDKSYEKDDFDVYLRDKVIKYASDFLKKKGTKTMDFNQLVDTKAHESNLEKTSVSGNTLQNKTSHQICENSSSKVLEQSSDGQTNGNSDFLAQKNDNDSRIPQVESMSSLNVDANDLMKLILRSLKN